MNKRIVFDRDDPATHFLLWTIVLGAAVLAARLLVTTGTFHSGLLYIAWPFGLSLALYALTPITDGTTWKKRFWNNFRSSTILVLASSIVLQEGYVCVVMALPLFFIGFLFSFFAQYLQHKFGKRSVSVHLFPLAIVLLSLEGVTSATTFERYNEVTYSKVVAASSATIKHRLSRQLKAKGQRHWILSIFPMPKSIGALTLKTGDVRIYKFVYHRWFAANTHHGEMRVTVVSANDHRIKTKIKDTSYIATYLKIHGTELLLEPVDDESTKITLTIAFDRNLDPIWYFGPLQRYAARHALKFFVEEFLAKDQLTMAMIEGGLQP